MLKETVPEDKIGSSYLVFDKMKDLSKYEHLGVVETLGVNHSITEIVIKSFDLGRKLGVAAATEFL